MGNSSPSLKLSLPEVESCLLVAAVVTLLVVLIEVFDYVELPFESTVGRLFASGSLISVGFVTSSIVGLGYGGLFLLMFFESASLPIPSEIVLPFAGYMVFKGDMSLEVAVLVSSVAGLLGALADYYIALRLGRPLVQRMFKWSGLKAEQLDRAEGWLSEKGSWSILVARFIPGLRSAISFPAGILRMRVGPFAVMSAIGALGWSALLIYLGYSAGSLWQTAFSQSGAALTQVLLIVMAFASASFILYYFSRRGIAMRDGKDDEGRRGRGDEEMGRGLYCGTGGGGRTTRIVGGGAETRKEKARTRAPKTKLSSFLSFSFKGGRGTSLIWRNHHART